MAAGHSERNTGESWDGREPECFPKLKQKPGGGDMAQGKKSWVNERRRPGREAGSSDTQGQAGEEVQERKPLARTK